jgi:WD40 repeat protein
MEDTRRAATTADDKADTNNATISKKPRPQREPLTATATDVFAKHPYLFVPFLDRVSLNRLFSVDREIHAASQSVTLPWPEKRFQAGANVWCVVFSPDGGFLASGCHNGTVQIRNRSSGGVPTVSRAFPFLLMGNFLRLAARITRLWKLADSSYRVFEGHTSWVMSVAFSPDGSTIASGSDDGSVRLWDVSEGTCTKTLRDNRMLGAFRRSPGLPTEQQLPRRIVVD